MNEEMKKPRYILFINNESRGNRKSEQIYNE
jgi:hypothetical protein